MAAAKRPRASSSSSSSLATTPELSSSHPTSDLPAPPPHKSSRIIHPLTSPSTHNPTTTTSGKGKPTPHHQQHSPILCNLPPTCQNRPTPIPNTIELERHYAKFHAHVCEFNHCGCVFPEERFLALHQTECHDPIAALRKERNEKIFECHIPAPTCGRKFSTPKTRRLHLIQAHSYPKQYFFAVTNKGIGGLLKKWGEGASLIRKDWKPREEEGGGLREKMKVDEDGEVDLSHTSDDDDDEDGDGEPADLDATPRIRARKTLSPTTTSQAQAASFRSSDGHPKNKSGGNNNNNADIAGLTHSLNALSLVPNSVRFGRGGKTRGFASAGGGGGGGGLVGGAGGSTRSGAMDVDVGGYGGRGVFGRGRGARGRGFRGRRIF